MERYKDNGLCDFLKEKYKNNEADSDIKFFDTDKSLLVVAEKKDAEPLCLIIDDRVKKEADLENVTESEREHWKLCCMIAQQAELPLFWIRYVDCEILNNSDYVHLGSFNKDQKKYDRIQLSQMPTIFSRFKIKAELENRTPQKRKNDSLSSAFHIWQRECLRVGIFADVDLIRLRGGRVVELMELKRSYIPFDKWNPYNNDINNFSILCNFCRKLGNVDFHIVFNAQVNAGLYGSGAELGKYYRRIEKRGKGDFYDKIDILKLYRVERRENVYYYPLPYPVLLGTISLEDYLEYGAYEKFLRERESEERI